MDDCCEYRYVECYEPVVRCQCVKRCEIDCTEKRVRCCATHLCCKKPLQPCTLPLVIQCKRCCKKFSVNISAYCSCCTNNIC